MGHASGGRPSRPNDGVKKRCRARRSGPSAAFWPQSSGRHRRLAWRRGEVWRRMTKVARGWWGTSVVCLLVIIGIVGLLARVSRRRRMLLILLTWTIGLSLHLRLHRRHLLFGPAQFLGWIVHLASFTVLARPPPLRSTLLFRLRRRRCRLLPLKSGIRLRCGKAGQWKLLHLGHP